jgi:hypothetical protein
VLQAARPSRSKTAGRRKGTRTRNIFAIRRASPSSSCFPPFPQKSKPKAHKIKRRRNNTFITYTKLVTMMMHRSKFLFVSSLLFMTSTAGAQGSTLIAGDGGETRDTYILPECQGHLVDENVHYIMAPRGLCMTAEGLMGTWGCRTTGSMQYSVCLPSLGGDVIGKSGDTCGCCGGVCPTLCECTCDGGVLVDEKILFGLVKVKRCYSAGLAEAMVAANEDMSCHTKCLQGSGFFRGTSSESSFP